MESRADSEKKRIARQSAEIKFSYQPDFYKILLTFIITKDTML